MNVCKIKHTPLFALMLAVTAVIWVLGYVYLSGKAERFESLQLLNRTQTQDIAWKAVTNTHRLAMKMHFDNNIMRPEVMQLLRQYGEKGDENEKNIVRVRLFRQLSPLYDMLRQYDVRQLHFHTPDNHSLLRFHAPHNSGDSLAASRPSVVEVNRTRKPIFGFETGRVVIGFRNVFPILWQGEHLGSVELSQSFEAMRRGMYDLDPTREYILVLKGAVLLPKLLDEHRKNYAQTLFSPDWLVEDPRGELPDSAQQLTPAMQQVYAQLKESGTFMRLLASGKTGSVAVSHRNGTCVVSLIPLHDYDGVQSAAVISFVRAPELDSLRASLIGNLLIFTLLVLAGGTAVYLFLFSVQTVKKQELQLSLITANIADGIYVLDGEGLISYVNQRACELLGYSRAELIGARAHELFHYHDEMVSGCPIIDVIKTGGRYEGEEKFTTQEGILLPVLVASQAMLHQNQIVGAVTVFSDISERKQLEEHLRLLSVTDCLTGVYNRRFMQETLYKELFRAERSKEPFCLIMLDLDNFKQVNDRFGHDAGDLVLRRLVEVVQGRIRNADCLARWGGEEFLLLLPGTVVDDAARLAGELLNTLSGSAIDGVGVVTASFGVTEYRAGDTVEELVKRVDNLMYAAKQSGRNCVRSDGG